MATNTKYIKFTKNENGEILNEEVTKERALTDVQNNLLKSSSISIFSSSSTVTESWIELITSIADAGSGQYLYKTTFRWLSNPFFNAEDIIGTGFGSNTSAVPGSEFLRHDYTARDLITQGTTSYWGPEYSTSKYIWTAQSRTGTGYAFQFGLVPGYPFQSALNHSGVMCFYVQTNTSSATVIDAYGGYGHKYLTVSPSIAFTSSGFLSITPGTGISQTGNTHANYQVQ